MKYFIFCSLTQVTPSQKSVETLDMWIAGGTFASFLSTTTDVFGGPIDPKGHDRTLRALRDFDPVDADVLRYREALLLVLLTSIRDVINRQMKPYINGRWSERRPEDLVAGQSAPAHNMGSERTLAIADALKKRAPRATLGFINGKIKASQNDLLPYLDSLPDHGRAAIAYASRESSALMKTQKELQLMTLDEAGRWIAVKATKRDAASRNKVAKSIECVLWEKSPWTT